MTSLRQLKLESVIIRQAGSIKLNFEPSIYVALLKAGSVTLFLWFDLVLKLILDL